MARVAEAWLAELRWQNIDKLKVNQRCSDNQASNTRESLATSFKSHHGILIIYGETVFCSFDRFVLNDYHVALFFNYI